MVKDHIAEQMGWLDEIITHPDNQQLFHDARLSSIQQELASHWCEENRLNLLLGLAEKFGEENVLAALDKIVDVNCQRNWGSIGESDNSLERFLKMLWEPLKESGFEFTFRSEGNKTTFCVTKCAMYDLAKTLGAEKWFYHLACLVDPAMMNGFKEKIVFSRSKTLMQGDSYCDHCYTDLSR